MPNLLATIQSIAVNAVNSTNPISFVFGTVTSASPLKIRMDQSTINLEGDSLILTSAVIERKMIIDKHTHEIGSTLAGHKHSFSGSITGTCTQAGTVSGSCSGTTEASTDISSKTVIVDTVISSKVIENKDTEHPLPVNEDVSEDDKKERIEVVINRGLQKNDKVVMLRVCGGQRFIVLSRVFEEA